MDLRIDAIELIEAIRPLQGQPLRGTALARRLGVSCCRLWTVIELLESRGILYTLPAWCPPPLRPGKRVARSPVVYLRERQAREPEERLLSYESCSPEAEVSFRGRMIDQIIRHERARSPASRFGHYSTPAMSRAALIVATPMITVGFQFPLHPCPSRRRWTGLCRSIREGWVDRGLVVYPGRWVFFAARWVVAVPAAGFLAGYRGWMEVLEKGTPGALRGHVRAGAPARVWAPARGPDSTGSPA